MVYIVTLRITAPHQMAYIMFIDKKPYRMEYVIELWIKTTSSGVHNKMMDQILTSNHIYIYIHVSIYIRQCPIKPGCAVKVAKKIGKITNVRVPYSCFAYRVDSQKKQQTDSRYGTTPVGCRGGNQYVEGYLPTFGYLMLNDLTIGYLILDDSLGFPYLKIDKCGGFTKFIFHVF